MNDKEFLKWIHERLIKVHGENRNDDYMWKLRSVIESTPEDNTTTKSHPVGWTMSSELKMIIAGWVITLVMLYGLCWVIKAAIVG